MTERDELSTADLASRRSDDPEPRHADDSTADVTAPAGDAPAAEAPAAEAPASPGPGGAPTTTPLLAAHDTEGFRARWIDVQTAFVDSPRESVEQADALVAEVMQHLAKTFADERSELERQWDRGDDIATDDLRTAFQRYRSFFERLLAT
jgi:hypothetical protein